MYLQYLRPLLDKELRPGFTVTITFVHTEVPPSLCFSEIWDTMRALQNAIKMLQAKGARVTRRYIRAARTLKLQPSNARYAKWPMGTGEDACHPMDTLMYRKV
jgi:hypothetical protein